MKRRIRLERIYRASLAEVWALWTTKDGIESWWGPDGFTVTVKKLDLRPGGELLYVMSATAPEQIAFMKQAGMPVAHDARIVYASIEVNRRLAYTHDVDFVPGVPTYAIETVVELHAAPRGVRMVLEFDPLHSPEWTSRATAGWENELSKLEKALAS